MFNTLLNLIVIASTFSPINNFPSHAKQSPAQLGNNFYKGQIDYMIFGLWCGECGEHCATMYKINSAGLATDRTDSYFKNKGQIIFADPSVKDGRYDKAKTLLGRIPNELLNSKSGQFGCPDCADGCGIYVEVKIGSSTRKFLIDTNLNQIPEFLQPFAREIHLMANEIRPKYF